MRGCEDRRVARSKQRIIQATVDLLRERGVAATSIEASADRSGVAKTTIYRHWPAKPELVTAALATLVAPPADPDTGSLRGDLYALSVGLAHALADGSWAGLLPGLVAAAELDPELAAAQERLTCPGDLTAVVLRRATARGELPPGVDPAHATALLTGPLFYRRLVSHEPVTADFARQVVDGVLNGLAATATATTGTAGRRSGDPTRSPQETCLP